MAALTVGLVESGPGVSNRYGFSGTAISWDIAVVLVKISQAAPVSVHACSMITHGKEKLPYLPSFWHLPRAGIEPTSKV